MTRSARAPKNVAIEVAREVFVHSARIEFDDAHFPSAAEVFLDRGKTVVRSEVVERFIPRRGWDAYRFSFGQTASLRITLEVRRDDDVAKDSRAIRQPRNRRGDS